MNNRPLQPGDLCLIIGGNTHQTNVGKTCTLVALVNGGESCKGQKLSEIWGWSWYCEGDGLCTHKRGFGVLKTGYAFIGPEHLIRIGFNPDAETETVGEEEEITA